MHGINVILHCNGFFRLLFYAHKFRSSVRYWIASPTCSARSAMVRATLRMLLVRPPAPAIPFLLLDHRRGR